MSEEAVAISEVPTPTIEISPDGPQSADELLASVQGQDLMPVAASPEEAMELLSPVKEKEAQAPEEEKAPEPTEKEAPEPEGKEDKEEETPEFGFERDEKDEKEAEKDFDAEAHDKETEEVAKGMDEKSGDAWRRLRNENRDLKTGATPNRREAELAARLEAAEKKAAQVEELQGKVEELTASDYALKVQSSPEYREKIRVPAKEVNDILDQVDEAYSFIDRETLEKAIKEPSLPTRAAMIDAIGVDEDGEQRLPSLVQSELQRAAMTYAKITASHERMLADAEGEWKEVQSKQEEAALRAAEEDRILVKRHLDENWEKAAKAFGEDKIGTARKNSASIDIRDETPSNRAYAQMAGEALPLALSQIRELKAQVAKLGGKVADEKAATPKLSDGAGKAESGKIEPPMDAFEFSRRAGDLSM